MTGRDDMNPATPDFDRLIAAWFETEARVQEPPDLIVRTLAERGRTRPRDTWLLPERWLPMELTMRRVRVPRLAGSLMILALIVILAAGAVIIVGSRRSVPPPFGLAANGNVALITPTGDIATVNPFTGQMSTILTSPETERLPTFSLDGERIAFVRSVEGGDAIYASDADGKTPIRLTPKPLSKADLLSWSPDGSMVAFRSADRAWVANADGSDAHQLAFDMDVDAEMNWRPPDGRELMVRAVSDGLAGFFLVSTNGSAERPITPIDGDHYDYVSPTWSSDGTRLTYSSDTLHSTHQLTIDGTDIEIVSDGGQDIGGPRLSPDGTLLATMVWLADGGVRVGVGPAGDPTPTLTLTGPRFSYGIDFSWSPDGKTILAAEWNLDQPWILDPAGGSGTPAPFKGPVTEWMDWQRRAR